MTLADVLSELGVPFMPAGHHHIRPGWTGVDCPRCSPRSSRWRLGISDSGRGAHCWQCGRLNAFDVLCELSNAPRKRVSELLRSLSGNIPTAEPEARRGRLVLPAAGPLLKPHRDYLSTRGFDPDEIGEKYGVRGIGMASKLGWRLLLPVTLRGEVVSWTTRSLRKDGLRYISASPEQESVPLKSLLYGEDHVGHAVIVVEGPIDVWAIGDGAVCTFGTAYTPEQAARISKYARRVVCFDGEPAAQRQARRLCRELRCFPGETVNVTLSGKDAAESSRKEIQELRRMSLS
jgi:hypothetical protein